MFFSNEVGIPFESFSLLHLLLFVFIAIGVTAIVLLRDNLRSWRFERRLAIGLASFALLWEFALYAWKVGNGIWTWDDGLPLGLCGLTLYLGMFAMFFHNKKAFLIGYFWTWGAIASVLFPDIGFSYDRFRFYQFMFGHMFFFFLYMYMIFVYRWVPSWKDYLRSLVILFVIGMIFLVVSHLTDTNLMFMVESEGTPLSMFEGGSYLWYVTGTIGLSAVVMAVWMLPFQLQATLLKQKVNQ